MRRFPCLLLFWACLLSQSVAQAQIASPTAQPPTKPSLASVSPELEGIRSGDPSTGQASQTLPNEDWLLKPVPKPVVGVYHSCQLYVPQDAAQARRVDRADPVGTFRNPHDAAMASAENPSTRKYLWCREPAGERVVDLLANHDDTVSRTLSHTLRAHRLLEQTISLDLEIGQKRAALTDDLKQQVAQIREDVRKEVAAQAAQRTWTIAGWSIAGAFFLTTVALTTLVAVR